MTGRPDAVLLDCLDTIASVATGVDVERAVELRARLLAGELRVMLVGEAKRGKSTLGNALIGRDLLPSGVTPVTAISTSIRSGPSDRGLVHFRDGSTRPIPLEAIAEFVTETANPENRLGVASVEVTLGAGADDPIGFVLVDTPGVGSLYSHNTDEAMAAQRSMDVAVLVLTVDPPISSSELDLFRQVSDQSVGLYVVLNKADRLDASELAEALAYVRAAVPGVPSDHLFACSARDGLRARAGEDPSAFDTSGVAALQQQLRRHVTTRGSVDLTQSLQRAIRRLVERLIDQRSTTAAALNALAGNRHEDVEAFARSLDEAVEIERAAADVAAAELTRQRQALTEDASAEVRRQITAVLAALDELIRQPDQPVSRLEKDGRDTIERLSRAGVDHWREQWGIRLDGVLEEMTRREQTALERATHDVHEAARSLLGVELLVAPGTVPLPSPKRFRYDFDPGVGWNQAQVAAIRRHLPGRARHHLVASYLRGEAEVLVDKHVGRARADLQERLEEAVRELGRDIASEFADLTATLAEAHEVALRAWSGTVSERDDESRRVADETEKLRMVVDGLDRIVREGPSSTQDVSQSDRRRTG